METSSANILIEKLLFENELSSETHLTKNKKRLSVLLKIFIFCLFASSLYSKHDNKQTNPMLYFDQTITKNDQKEFNISPEAFWET